MVDHDSPLLENSRRKDAEHASSVNTKSYSDKANDLSKAFALHQYLCKTDHGAILVTTRSIFFGESRAAYLLGQVDRYE